ncbi:uncharacterized protein LOC141764858 isoform X2 [Sebastes fasciatus]|uniref:uncharacterized protein LOC141764858 isoform X2 n=1 Tax=Sebastes fasciatus TaxID=394691 RepID=UPI003D9F4BFE
MASSLPQFIHGIISKCKKTGEGFENTAMASNCICSAKTRDKSEGGYLCAEAPEGIRDFLRRAEEKHQSFRVKCKRGDNGLHSIVYTSLASICIHSYNTRVAETKCDSQDHCRVRPTGYPELRRVLISRWTISEIHDVVPKPHYFLFCGQ